MICELLTCAIFFNYEVLRTLPPAWSYICDSSANCVQTGRWWWRSSLLMKNVIFTTQGSVTSQGNHSWSLVSVIGDKTEIADFIRGYNETDLNMPRHTDRTDILLQLCPQNDLNDLIGLHVTSVIIWIKHSFIYY